MIDFLKTIDLFADMSEESLKALLSCSGAELHNYEKGQAVFSENQTARYIFVLLEGKLLMTKHFSSGRRIIFCEIHERDPLLTTLTEHEKACETADSKQVREDLFVNGIVEFATRLGL